MACCVWPLFQGETDCVLVGNDIPHIEAVRSTLKNQFDRNVVVNFSYQEQVLDHVFAHLGLGGESSVTHPVLITEPVCNPLQSRHAPHTHIFIFLKCYRRSQMSELLFECYGVPAVTYGVDALFSAHSNLGIEEGTDALVVASGHQTPYVLPVLNGHFDSVHCKR